MIINYNVMSVINFERIDLCFYLGWFLKLSLHIYNYVQNLIGMKNKCREINPL